MTDPQHDYTVPRQPQFPPQPMSAPDPGPRPRVVTVVFGLMCWTALANVVASQIVFKPAFMGSEAAEDPAGMLGASIALGVATVLIAVGFVITAVQLRKGRQGARIAAYITHGIACLCGLGGAGASVATLFAEAPEGAGPLLPLASVFIIADYVAYPLVIVLLSLPSVNRWFKANTVARRARLGQWVAPPPPAA